MSEDGRSPSVKSVRGDVGGGYIAHECSHPTTPHQNLYEIFQKTGPEKYDGVSSTTQHFRNVTVAYDPYAIP